jgi:hypothetical protein
MFSQAAGSMVLFRVESARIYEQLPLSIIVGDNNRASKHLLGVTRRRLLFGAAALIGGIQVAGRPGRNNPPRLAARPGALEFLALGDDRGNWIVRG